ncbi:MAG: hypothetical protein NZ927_00790 [Candidatus Calescibacterium sp.]|nr:hypothetical protein [Candidatus Calescibacterium sp.]MCX7733751.1 hypothetical protein [bacterium]MDW8086685.1 hypothetical protein [Candidatus Calescibacterium sp.]
MLRIEAEIRQKLGKEDAKKIRKQGYVTGIIYARGKVYEQLKLKLADLNSILKNQNDVFEIKVSNKVYKVKLKGVQIHPVTDKPLHFDFYALEEPYSEN